MKKQFKNPILAGRRFGKTKTTAEYMEKRINELTSDLREAQNIIVDVAECAVSPQISQTCKQYMRSKGLVFTPQSWSSKDD